MTAEPKLPKARIVSLDAVEDLAETRDVRARGLDHEHVHRMVPFVGELPPIDVVALSGGRFGVLAGYHRLAAHREADRKTIRVLVHDVAVEEWFAFGVRSNTKHGLLLTTTERKAAAKRMLAEDGRRSDRAIASDCGLDHKTVGKLRYPQADDESTGELPQLRVGRDGKTRRVAITSEAAHDAEPVGRAAGMLEEEPELPVYATEPTITKPDLGGGISHPARFSDAILKDLAGLLACHGAGTRILDPFAGTGRIHLLNGVLRPFEPYEVFGIEIEWEWAALHPNTQVGNALDLPFPEADFDAIVTSPCYGNRLADHHQAVDPESRRSYTHDLGRELSSDNAGALQWGPEYRDFHERAWKEATRVLRPSGLFVLNVKDHTRDGERQYVAGWHVTTLCRLGFTLLEHVEVATRSLRVGENADARWPEQIYVLRCA